MIEQKIIQYASTKEILHILKIGSESFAKRENGIITVQTEFLETMAKNIKKLRKASQKFVIVSSGAVQMGRKNFEEDGLDWNNTTKQYLASEGNTETNEQWKNIFAKNGIRIAQGLLNSEVDNGNYIQHVGEALNHGRIMIFNENDLVATRQRIDGIIFKDNDTLVGRIAKDLAADKLAIFSSIDGYLEHYNTTQEKLIRNLDVNQIKALIKIETTKNEIKLTAGDNSEVGTGGILTKLEGILDYLENVEHGQARIINSSKLESVKNYFGNTHNGTHFSN
jgi:glutamate 5-kinase